MKTRLVYLDTETHGLDMLRHEIWEVAWAVEEGPVESGVVVHSPHARFQPQAREVNSYYTRGHASMWDWNEAIMLEHQLWKDLHDATVVGANPCFDLVRLSLRWERTAFADQPKSKEPWHYRSIDVATYAMPLLGYTRPQGLNKICADLRLRGYEIPEPDHSSAGDVKALRSVYRALQTVVP